MKYLKKIGINAQKAFKELKDANHDKIKSVLNDYSLLISKNKKK